MKLVDDLKNYTNTLGVKEVKAISVSTLEERKDIYEQVRDIFPPIQSIISFVIPFPRGTLYLLKNPTRGLPYYTRLAGLGGRLADENSAKISIYLEERGFSALPLFICTPLEMRGKFDLWGYASQIDLAAKCGVGWIGKNGLLITSKYGPRVIIGTVLTDAPLEEEKTKEAGKCPDNCLICVDMCPAKALDDTGKVNRLTCTVTQAIAPLSLMMAKEFSMKEQRDMIVNVGAVDEHTWYRCNACVIHCPLGL